MCVLVGRTYTISCLCRTQPRSNAWFLHYRPLRRRAPLRMRFHAAALLPLAAGVAHNGFLRCRRCRRPVVASGTKCHGFGGRLTFLDYTRGGGEGACQLQTSYFVRVVCVCVCGGGGVQGEEKGAKGRRSRHRVRVRVSVKFGVRVRVVSVHFVSVFVFVINLSPFLCCYAAFGYSFSFVMSCLCIYCRCPTVCLSAFSWS
jgi:hypothetical protein